MSDHEETARTAVSRRKGRQGSVTPRRRRVGRIAFQTHPTQSRTSLVNRVATAINLTTNTSSDEPQVTSGEHRHRCRRREPAVGVKIHSWSAMITWGTDPTVRSPPGTNLARVGQPPGTVLIPVVLGLSVPWHSRLLGGVETRGRVQGYPRKPPRQRRSSCSIQNRWLAQDEAGRERGGPARLA